MPRIQPKTVGFCQVRGPSQRIKPSVSDVVFQPRSGRQIPKLYPYHLWDLPIPKPRNLLREFSAQPLRTLRLGGNFAASQTAETQRTQRLRREEVNDLFRWYTTCNDASRTCVENRASSGKCTIKKF